ncbi:MAG TPA: SCP2 sterol-binding domain-containing protein [Acidimicrobiales bacterium]|nr:SCP2 sterol-binding domain-containing protein [Acidimicrobiales bacterium]
MTRFLSPEWLALVEEAAGRDERVRQASSTVELTVRHVVRGGPQGDVAYTVRIADGVVRVRPGGTDGDVELTQDYDTAVAISRGMLTPAAAFATGRLKLGGRVDTLVRQGDALAALTDAFAGVRETTEY